METTSPHCNATDTTSAYKNLFHGQSSRRNFHKVKVTFLVGRGTSHHLEVTHQAVIFEMLFSMSCCNAEVVSSFCYDE